MPQPGGAFYAWPNVTAACEMIGANDSEEFRKRLLTEAGVARCWRHPFRSARAHEGHTSASVYAASNEAIEKGVARMAAFINSNTKVKKTLSHRETQPLPVLSPQNWVER